MSTAVSFLLGWRRVVSDEKGEKARKKDTERVKNRSAMRKGEEWMSELGGELPRNASIF